MLALMDVHVTEQKMFVWLCSDAHAILYESCLSWLKAVSMCADVCHMCRDLKPENFLLSNKEPHAPLKATDFGLSVFYHPGQVFTDIVGSAYYVAPEVIPLCIAGRACSKAACKVQQACTTCRNGPFVLDSDEHATCLTALRLLSLVIDELLIRFTCKSGGEPFIPPVLYGTVKYQAILFVMIMSLTSAA